MIIIPKIKKESFDRRYKKAKKKVQNLQCKIISKKPSLNKSQLLHMP